MIRIHFRIRGTLNVEKDNTIWQVLYDREQDQVVDMTVEQDGIYTFGPAPGWTLERINSWLSADLPGKQPDAVHEVRINGGLYNGWRVLSWRACEIYFSRNHVFELDCYVKATCQHTGLPPDKITPELRDFGKSLLKGKESIPGGKCLKHPIEQIVKMGGTITGRTDCSKPNISQKPIGKKRGLTATGRTDCSKPNKSNAPQ